MSTLAPPEERLGHAVLHHEPAALVGERLDEDGVAEMTAESYSPGGAPGRSIFVAVPAFTSTSEMKFRRSSTIQSAGEEALVRAVLTDEGVAVREVGLVASISSPARSIGRSIQRWLEDRPVVAAIARRAVLPHGEYVVQEVYLGPRGCRHRIAEPPVDGHEHALVRLWSPSSTRSGPGSERPEIGLPRRRSLPGFAPGHQRGSSHLQPGTPVAAIVPLQRRHARRDVVRNADGEAAIVQR